MYSKSDNKEIMSGFEADAIIELFHLLQQRYQEGLEQSMKGKDIASVADPHQVLPNG